MKSEKKVVSISYSCKLFGKTRQAYYKSIRASQKRQQQEQAIISFVEQERRFLPRLGTRKLHHRLSEMNISYGRDRLFDILRANYMLIKPKKSYTKTTHSKHWLRKYPNLYNQQALTKPETCFVSDITYVKSNEGTLARARLQRVLARR